MGCQAQQLAGDIRQRVENQWAGAAAWGAADQRHALLLEQCRQLLIEHGHQRRDQGKHLLLVQQVLQGMLGTGLVGASIGHHQFQAPAMNAALLVYLSQAVLKYGTHDMPGFSQWATGWEQGAQAQHASFHPEVAFIAQTFEVGREVALVSQGQFEARHGGVQTLPCRVDAVLDRAGQRAVAVGRVAATVALSLALPQRQALPVEAGRAYPPSARPRPSSPWQLAQGSTLAGTLMSLAPTRAISCASLLETPCRYRRLPACSFGVRSSASAEWQRLRLRSSAITLVALVRPSSRGKPAPTGPLRLIKRAQLLWERACPRRGRHRRTERSWLNAQPAVAPATACAGQWRLRVHPGGSCSSACRPRHRQSAGSNAARGWAGTGRCAPAPDRHRPCHR